MIEIIENFITKEEQQTLLEWVNSCDVPVLEAENFTPDKLTPRRRKIFAGDAEAFSTIQAKIQERFQCTPPDDWQGQIFIHEPGTFTRQHTDKDSLRMSLIIQQAIGGNIVHGGKSYTVPERALAVFNPKIPHAVGQVKEGTRIVITFFWTDSQEQP